MAPAVPFALLGVVQLVAVAGWIGLAAASLFPRLRRRITPAVVVGALLMAAADTVAGVQFGTSSSSGVGWLRVVGLALLALGLAGGVGQTLAIRVGAVGGVVVPLGAPPTPAYVGGVLGLLAAAGAWLRGRRAEADALLGAALAGAMVFTGVAAALAEPSRTSVDAALAQLSARAAATVLLIVALVQLARTMLLGKLAGAIVAGVVAMAAGAVGVVGTGVADAVQSQQSQRLLQVAAGEQQTLNDALGARAALFAQVVARCPTDRTDCIEFLKLFSDQASYFAAIVQPGKGVDEIATNDAHKLPPDALVQLAGSAVVQAALQPGATATSTVGGPVLLPGSPPVLAVVEAAPGRPGNSGDARVKPTYAAVYGVGIVDAYLVSVKAQNGYDYSIVADGQVVASSLTGSARQQVQQLARSAAVDRADVAVNRVVAAEGSAPTAAFVSIDAAGNGDVRLATLVVSQPAGEALRAQRSVLQRMFLTALVALLLVGVLAVWLARRIALPIRRLTVAAGRVRRGDLETTTSVESRDEVGSLARAFEAMTSSLRSATGDLRAAAEQEAQLRARLETVVESMNDGLVVTDPRGRITSVNATAAGLLGVAAEDVVGRKIEDVVTIKDADGHAVALGAAGRRTVEGQLATAAGTSVPVRYSASSLADRQGRVVVLADRTRDYEIERMKTEFLANVSHELRTPLTPIRGYAEILARRTDLSRAQVVSFLDEILGSTARMSRAVELLVDVAALEAGRVAAEPGKVSVRRFVEERMKAWKAAYPDRADDLKRRLATGLPTVAIDPRWVGRALDELVDNAVKYTPAGTPITLIATVTDDDAGVRIAVRDAGPGFDPATAAELVGDFAQADASETRRVGGMGLGLGFVNRVAERLGLDFSVDATPGVGAEFAIVLPRWSDE